MTQQVFYPKAGSSMCEGPCEERHCIALGSIYRNDELVPALEVSERHDHRDVTARRVFDLVQVSHILLNLTDEELVTIEQRPLDYRGNPNFVDDTEPATDTTEAINASN